MSSERVLSVACTSCPGPEIVPHERCGVWSLCFATKRGCDTLAWGLEVGLWHFNLTYYVYPIGSVSFPEWNELSALSLGKPPGCFHSLRLFFLNHFHISHLLILAFDLVPVRLMQEHRQTITWHSKNPLLEITIATVYQAPFIHYF